MSSEVVHYEIKITPVRVPPALRGVSLPVEIIPQEGEAKQSLITLEENRTETKSVEWPGRYFVRTVLPSGQLIVKTAIVPEASTPQGEALGEVTLDFGRYIPTAETYARFTTDKLKKPSRIRGLLRRYIPDLVSMVGGVFGVGVIQGERIADPGVSVDYGLFVRWSMEASNESLESSSDTLVIKPCGKDAAELPGKIELEQHPGWAENSEIWRPLLMRARFLLPPGGAKRQEALLIYPPSDPPLPLTLLPDPEPGVNPAAPWLLAYSDSGDRDVDLMFRYIRNSDLHMAQQLAPGMIDRAQAFLRAKKINPVQATLAAYALLKVSNEDRKEWALNLANWFKYLPDGAIIYGWYLIRDGKAEQAHGFFRTALERGVPMYSEGVRLLRNGLNFLRGLYPEDAQVQADAARANRIFDLANLDSDLTCLRLLKGLAVKFDK
jgi:hypothetical protein